MKQLTLATAIAAALSIAPAFAAGGLEEVIVTAQKREQNLQDVPVSVAAFSGDFLRDSGVPDITALSAVTPNLNFTVGTGGGGSTVNAFIRGVGEFDFLLTTDPAVGMYVDGVYIPRTFGANMELADVDHIEVLRGPQGTLFGKNSIGGALNITTKKPTHDLHYSLELGVGSNELRSAKAYLSTGLTDDLAMSLSLLRKTADGWQSRPGDNAGEKNQFAGRAILLWTPSDVFQSLLTIDNLHQKQMGYPNVMLSFDPSASVMAGAYQTVALPPCCTPNKDIDRSSAEGPLSKDNVNNTGVNWTNTFQLTDSLSLKSISSYRELGALFGRDGDNSAVVYAGDIHHEQNRAFSQEFQFNGKQFDDKLNWVAGLYYFDEKTVDNTQLYTADGLFAALLAAGPSNPYFAYLDYVDFNLDYRNRQTTENYSAYGHVTYELTKELTLIAGIRYTRERKDFDQNAMLRTFGVPLLPPGPTSADCSDVDTTGSYDCKKTWEKWSPKFGAEYRIDEDLMLYALASSGFRSGGFNGRPTSPQYVKSYNPETLKSLEAGFKSQWLDNRLRLNGSIYHNVYEDMQLLLIRGNAIVVENAGKAHIDGAELEWQAALTDDWDLYGGVGYLHNEYKKWSDDDGDHTDRQMPYAPRWTGNLGSAYRIRTGAGLVTLRADVAVKDDQYLDADNTKLLHAGAYSELNASIAYKPIDALEFMLSGRNLGDKRVLNGGFNATEFFGFTEGSYNPPRSYYLSATYRY